MFGISDLWWVVINSFISFIYLFFISKILGKKQIAQLEFIDYVVGISLGSIAAELSTETEQPFYHNLIAMSIFFVLAYLVAIIGRKNTFLKKLLKGKPTVLIYEGQIDYKALCNCKIDVNDLLSMLREKNFFNVNDVEFAIFEPSGKLSVLPKGALAPVTAKDVDKGKIKKAKLTNIILTDGKVLNASLKAIGKDKDWLLKKLRIDKKQVKNYILATYDEKTDKISLFKKNKTLLVDKNGKQAE